MVRDAFVTSVTCRAPPVSFQISQLSTVPKASSPRCGPLPRAGDVVEHPANLTCPRSTRRSPGRSSAESAARARRAEADRKMRQVRRSCQTMAL